jgi:hypothetical protein
MSPLFHRVGIALAAYEPHLAYFREQLASIQRQTHSSWVCQITLDSSLENLKSKPELRQFFADPRFLWSENPRRLGTLKNFERAIQLVLKQGIDAIACSDQDDIWFENKLEESLKALNQSGPLSLVHCDMQVLQGNQLSKETAWRVEHRGVHNVKLRHLLIRNVVAGCGMLFDAELARKFPEIPSEAQYHDHWYPLVAAYLGGVHAVPLPLYAYRIHSHNVLGITKYQSLFSKTIQHSSAGNVLSECLYRWNLSAQFSRCLSRFDLQLNSFDSLLFLFRWDFGVGLVILGILHLWDDRPLARACFARAVGKCVSLFKNQ